MLGEQIEMHKYKFSVKTPFDCYKKEDKAVNIKRLDNKRS
jgi:hypothetical protein